MKNEEMLQCPLLRGLDPMHRAELLGVMRDSKVQEEVEECLAALSRPAEDADVSPSSGDELPVKRDFEREVQTWNPKLSLWRRCAKE